MPSWITGIIVSYLVNAISHLGTSVNWAGITTALDNEIGKAPHWLQALLLPEVPMVIGVLKAALADTADLDAIVADVVSGNYAKVLTDIEAVFTKVAA